MLRIRLTRTGKKHQPTYRIVVAEHTAPIKGKYIEILGYYLPSRTPKVLEVQADRVKHWLSNGAQASDTVHNLLVDKGILTEKRDIKYARAKAETKVETPPKAEKATEEVEADADATTDASETVQEPTPETDEPSNDEPAPEKAESEPAQ